MIILLFLIASKLLLNLYNAENDLGLAWYMISRSAYA